jgi:hypothetical protein
MKVLVEYDCNHYLVHADHRKEPDLMQVYEKVNEPRWPDEYQSMRSIVNDHKVLAYFTDESELVG